MRKQMRTLIAALALFLCLSSSGFAAAPLPGETEVRAIEAYLSSISTLRAKFIQTAGDGTQKSGLFLLKRPGRMRFEYAGGEKGLDDFIVADGTFIHYYDAEMKQQSTALIGKSLADFFLRKDVKLSGDLSVSQIRRDGGLLQVTLEQAGDPLAGSLTLGFTEKPLTLKKWRVVDAEGSITEVDLFEIETGIKLSSEIFKYYDPEAKKKKYN